MQDRPGTIARPRDLVLMSAAGVLLAILMTWPLATDLSHLGRTQSNDADGQYSIWNVAWVARTIVADTPHLFDANIFFPHKLALAYSEANLLPGAIGAPVYWLTKNPWLTLNVVMLAAFASSFVCAWLLFAYLTGDRLAAAAGAIVYAYCPYVFSHLSHIQLLFTGGIPLSLYALHRVADGAFRLKAEATNSNPVASAFRRKNEAGRKNEAWRKGIALGLVLAAQALCCAYYGVFAGLIVGYATLVLAQTRGLWRSSAYWSAIAIGAAAALALLLPLYVPFVLVQRETGFVRTVADTARWAAKPIEYIVSSAHAHQWLLTWARAAGWRGGEVLFPGILATLLGAAGLVTAARAGGRDRETTVLYGSLGLLALWASFGPNAGLYRVLYCLPTFSFLRAPSRLGLVVAFVLALFACFALRRLFAASPRYCAVLAPIAIVLAVADTATFPLKWYEAPQIPQAYASLRSSPKGPVAEFPFYADRVAMPLHAQYMLLSTAHWLPLLNGYSDVIPADFREAAPVLDGFPSDEAFKMLAKRRVRYVAVHWDMYVGRADEIRARLTRYESNLRLMAADPRMSLYELMRVP